MVEYSLANNSYLRFYLAPKVCLFVLALTQHTLTLYRLATRSRHIHDRKVGQDIGMTWCFRRFNDLLLGKKHAVDDHTARLRSDDQCFYTNSNEIFTAHSNFSPMYSSIHLFFDDPGRAPPTSAGLIAYLPNPFVFEKHKDREQVTFQPNLHCNKHGRSARNPRFGSCQPCKRNVDAHIKQSRSMTDCSKR